VLIFSTRHTPRHACVKDTVLAFTQPRFPTFPDNQVQIERLECSFICYHTLDALRACPPRLTACLARQKKRSSKVLRMYSSTYENTRRIFHHLLPSHQTVYKIILYLVFLEAMDTVVFTELYFYIFFF